MITYHLKLSIRRIKQEKGFLSINLFGLVIGITAFLILFNYVLNENSFDKHIPDYQNIYRVHSVPVGSELSPWARSLGIIHPASLTFPEVEEATMFGCSPEGTARIGDKSFQLNDILSVDEGFFRLFSVKMLTGNYTEITNPNVVFISERVAEKYFKGENPIGKTIELGDLEDNQKLGNYEIRGVVENMHPKTHFRYDILISQNGALQEQFKSLLNNPVQYAYNYVKLNNNSDLSSVADKYVKYYNASSFTKIPGLSGKLIYNFNLLPIVDIHLKSDYKFELKENQNKINVRLFILISFVILIISMLNFINLIIAKIIKQSREFGLRKFIGANTRQLMQQILAEVVLKSLLAIGMSLLIIELFMPKINHFFNIDFDIYYSEPVIYLVILGIELFTVGLTTVFVKFYFFRKASTIGILSSKNNYTRSPVLKTLLVMQVCIVIFLLTAILLVNRQVNYILNQPLGFDKENVIIIHLKDRSKDRTVFASELKKQSNVLSVGFTGNYFGYPALTSKLDGFGLSGNLEHINCDYDFLRTMDIDLIENWIDKPSSELRGIIINEHLYKRLIERHGSIENYRVFQKSQEFKPDFSRMRIVGVVKDFNYNSAHVPIGDFAFAGTSSFLKFITIRLAQGDLREAMKQVEKTWERLYKGQPINYFFLEDKINEQYKAEMLLRKILLFFSMIGIVISIIGVTAFSLIISQQRTKEIGIRKVNGAKVSEILAMLNKNFVKWVTIAFVLATPLAYFTLNKWLENFAYKTELSWWIFALGGLLTLGITLLTVSWQSWKAATRNPVQALRYE